MSTHDLLQSALEALETATSFTSKKVRDQNPRLTADIRAALAAAPAADAVASVAVSEEVSQPWYDLAWRLGAQQHASFAGDELESISFTPSQFESLAATLAAQPQQATLPASEPAIWMDAGHLREVLNGNDMPAYCQSQRADRLVPLYTRAQPQADAPALPVELQGVAEAAGAGAGFWRSCSGCHELNEGHATGPISKVFKCALGTGCSECGGLGAIWDTTDYGAMADHMARSLKSPQADAAKPTFQVVPEDDLTVFEDWLMKQSHKAAFFPVDALKLTNIALHCIREVRATRAQPAPQALGAAEVWHAVLSPSGLEGVIFKDRADADWTAAKQPSNRYDAPTIGCNFRECYDHAEKFTTVVLAAATTGGQS